MSARTKMDAANFFSTCDKFGFHLIHSMVNSCYEHIRRTSQGRNVVFGCRACRDSEGLRNIYLRCEAATGRDGVSARPRKIKDARCHASSEQALAGIRRRQNHAKERPATRLNISGHSFSRGTRRIASHSTAFCGVILRAPLSMNETSCGEHPNSSAIPACERPRFFRSVRIMLISRLSTMRSF